jgi:iron uptake system component EfeO
VPLAIPEFFYRILLGCPNFNFKGAEPMGRIAILVAMGAMATLAAGCGSSDTNAPPGAKKLSFELTDAGCVPHSASAPAGTIVFEAENAGTTAVTEFEVLEGDKILGEKEDLSEGLSGSFSLTLKQGTYTLKCTGGEREEGVLTVTANKN